MTAEKLLQERYIVIAPVPNEPQIPVGFVIDDIQSDRITVISKGFVARFEKSELDRCPANFRKLTWWEKRDIADLPEYVKNETKSINVKWEIGHTGLLISNLLWSDSWHNVAEYPTLLPATKEEYDQFMATKNQSK